MLRRQFGLLKYILPKEEKQYIFTIIRPFTCMFLSFSHLYLRISICRSHSTTTFSTSKYKAQVINLPNHFYLDKIMFDSKFYVCFLYDSTNDQKCYSKYIKKGSDNIKWNGYNICCCFFENKTNK